MKIFLKAASIILLVVLIGCAIFYFVTGIFSPISGLAVILFIITVAGYQKYKA